MMEKEKRKNLDTQAIRSRIKELEDIEIAESNQRAAVIVQKIINKLADGKADIDSRGNITVVFFSRYPPSGCIWAIRRQLQERGFDTDQWWGVDRSWIPYMYYATLRLKDK
jgi:hypothetical protein